MSYVKNTWAAGDKITAAKLNNLENGVEAASGGGSGVIMVDIEEGNVPSHNFLEIMQHIANGGYVYCNVFDDIYTLAGVYEGDGEIVFRNIYLEANSQSGTLYYKEVSIENGVTAASISEKQIPVSIVQF